ncbi:MAG TPA: hydrogenase maturation protease, partial [Phycisphaerae bacterium]|nr:hydrogenase maturation protease [Phycisphaerae bacterium]
FLAAPSCTHLPAPGLSTVSQPIRIIAWGNMGRRDDGSALVLAERLAERYAGVSDVVVQEYHQLGPELVDDLHHCRLAIFVDAHAHEDGADVTFGRLLPAQTGGLDTHHCPPDVLLGLTAAMHLNVPEAWLVGIRGYDWDFGDILSERTRQAMLEAEEKIVALLDDALGKGSTSSAGGQPATS